MGIADRLNLECRAVTATRHPVVRSWVSVHQDTSGSPLMGVCPLLNSADEDAFVSVCLSCMSVSRITQKTLRFYFF